MPHTFVKTTITPADLVQCWQETSCCVGGIRIKIQQGYNHPSNLRCIFPCIVIESVHHRKFYIEVRQKDRERLILHLDTFTPVPRTVGIRLALAWFGQRIKAYDKNGLVEEGNIGDYFHLLNLNPSQQGNEVMRLKDKLAPQMNAFDLRAKAKWFTIFLEKLNPPLNWPELFGNDQPVEIEIGPGKGKFILNKARTQPHHNYVAIEWSGNYMKILSEKIPKHNLKNIRLLKADARIVFKEWIAPSSVAEIHIYYPDPWWKKKHKKYTLFTNEFVRSVQTTLADNGVLSLATDVQEVYDSVTTLLKSGPLLKRIQHNVYRSKHDTPPGRSNFEIKQWQNNQTIYEAKWQKVKNNDLAFSY